MDSDLVPIRRLVPTLAALALLACGILAAPAAASPAEASPTSLNFPQEAVGGTSPAQTVTVSNPAPGAVHVDAVALVGVDSADFAISGDTCAAAVLAQGETCAVGVRFAPQASGSREATLALVIEGELPIVVPLTGTGQTKKLTVPGTTAFATTTVGGAASEKVLLKNNGEAGINVDEVKFEGADAGDFGIEGSNCVGFIGTGMSCELSVRFTPGASGARAAVLRVSTDAVPADYVVELSGQGAAPEVSFEPGSYDFGLVEEHSGGARASFNLRNDGVAAVQLSNLEISGPGAGEFSIPGSGCWGMSLAPGTSCWIEVQFNANQEGSFAAALAITAGTVVFQAPLDAEAARPQITPSQTPLAFAPTAVGSRRLAEVTLTNTGRLPVAFFIAIVSGGDVSSFHLVEETCTSNVFAGSPRIFEPGEACRAKIAFEPTEAGARQATVSIFGAGEGALQFPVEGTAVAPRLSLSPPDHDFGEVGVGSAGPTQTFVLRNESGEPETIESASLVGADVGEFDVRADECSEATLAPGGSCTVAVRFAPESSGAKAASLRLRGPGGTTVGRLSGEGVAAGATAAVAAAGGGRVSLSLRSHPSLAGGKVTIGRARCESSEPCTLRIGGLASGRIATGAGGRPGIRGLAPSRLTLAPGASAPIITAMPREFRAGAGRARLSVAMRWRTGGEHGGGRHSFLLRAR
jgi:hypothetical protein